MATAIKRIQMEMSRMKNSICREIPENISAGPVSENNLLHWSAIIIGAVGTPYEGGMFKLTMVFPNNYPFVPPVVRFETKLFHPNISETGEICLDVLKYNWSPAYSISHILLSIVALLSDPNPDDPLNPDASHLYKADKNVYNDRVRAYVQQYAVPNSF